MTAGPYKVQVPVRKYEAHGAYEGRMQLIEIIVREHQRETRPCLRNRVSLQITPAFQRGRWLQTRVNSWISSKTQSGFTGLAAKSASWLTPVSTIIVRKPAF